MKTQPLLKFSLKKPNINNFCSYGSEVFIKVSEVSRNIKRGCKADMGTFIGYENNRYRVVRNNKIVWAKHVSFVEENMNLIGIGTNKSENMNNDRVENEGL